MGRKKKITSPLPETKAPQPVSNKINIGYTGDISIKFVRGNKVRKIEHLKNTGTIYLFELFAAYVAGIVRTEKLPKYLYCYNETPVGVGEPDLSNCTPTCSIIIPYENAALINSSSSYGTRFSFTIPFTNLSSSTTNLLILKGQLGDGSNILAYYRLGDSENFAGDGKTNILVE